MLYKFLCTNKTCKCEEEKNIPVADYNTEKEKQFCSNCGAKMKRIIEWTGIASGNGEGWCGKSTGNAI